MELKQRIYLFDLRRLTSVRSCMAELAACGRAGRCFMHVSATDLNIFVGRTWSLAFEGLQRHGIYSRVDRGRHAWRLISTPLSALDSLGIY